MGSNSVNDLREGALRQFSGREVTLGEGRFPPLSKRLTPTI